MSVHDSLKSVVYEHMSEQPYRVFCAKCGKDLEIQKSYVDDDCDLFLYLEPCKSCCVEASDE